VTPFQYAPPDDLGQDIAAAQGPMPIAARRDLSEASSATRCGANGWPGAPWYALKDWSTFTSLVEARRSEPPTS